MSLVVRESGVFGGGVGHKVQTRSRLDVKVRPGVLGTTNKPGVATT